jgi:hypothetical protein
MDAEIARDEHEKSHAEFLKLSSDSIPAEIEESFERVQFALQAHTLAAKRLNDFTRNGTVPENL